MRAEIVHEQIVRIVDEEVQSVNHLSVVAHERHLDSLLDDLRDRLLRTLLLLKQFHLHLLL